MSDTEKRKKPWSRGQKRRAIGVLVLAALVAAGTIFALTKAGRPVDRAVALANDKSVFTAQVEREKKAETAAQEALKVHLTWPQNRGLRVFFAGDSLSAGFYSSVKEKAYRPRVVRHLEQFGAVEAIRATKQPSEKLFQIGNVESIPDKNVDLVIIELGTNDAGRTELSKFSAAYQNLIDVIRKGSPKAQIICAGVWGAEGAIRGPYDTAIQDVCSANDGQYVDLTAVFTADTRGPAGTNTWAGRSDNFHPNDKGHSAIADLLIGRISVKS